EAAPSERTRAGTLVDQLILSIRGVIPHGHPLPEELWRTRHRGILILLWLHVVGVSVFGLAMGRETAFHVLAECSMIGLLALLGSAPRFSRGVRATFASLGLMMSSALLVHFSNGYIEMHFHFFVMVGVITLYQQWRPF